MELGKGQNALLGLSTAGDPSGKGLRPACQVYAFSPGLDEPATNLDPSGRPLSALVHKMIEAQPAWGYGSLGDTSLTTMLLPLRKEFHEETTFKSVDCSLTCLPGQFTLQSQTEAKLDSLSLAHKQIRVGLGM